MIIINLKGGLGNQMFQYALGRKMSLKNEDELKLDVYGLEVANKVGDIYRPFDLGEFNIQNIHASAEEIKKLKYPLGIFSKLMRRFRFKVLKKTHGGWEPEILEQTEDMYLDGFWQSPKYFEDIREEILKDFSLKSPLSPNFLSWTSKIQETNSVALHVRRSDYASNPRVLKEFGVCSANYYSTAITYLKKHTNSASFFIFSDDIEWVKKNLTLPDNSIFVSDKTLTTTEELILMSKCSHNIIANSSFSWWSAWLNTNERKIVIAPIPWFNTKKHIYKDLIPDLWISLPKD